MIVLIRKLEVLICKIVKVLLSMEIVLFGECSNNNQLQQSIYLEMCLKSGIVQIYNPENVVKIWAWV